MYTSSTITVVNSGNIHLIISTINNVADSTIPHDLEQMGIQIYLLKYQV